MKTLTAYLKNMESADRIIYILCGAFILLLIPALVYRWYTWGRARSWEQAVPANVAKVGGVPSIEDSSMSVAESIRSISRYYEERIMVKDAELVRMGAIIYNIINEKLGWESVTVSDKFQGDCMISISVVREEGVESYVKVSTGKSGPNVPFTFDAKK